MFSYGFGCGGGMMFDFFFFFCGFDGCGGGDGGCCGYGLVVRCLIFFFFPLWVRWLWWWIGDYDGGLVFYFVCGFGCVCVGDGGCGGCYC